MTNNHKSAMEAMLADYGQQPNWHQLSINPAWIAAALALCDAADSMGVAIDGEHLIEHGTSFPDGSFAPTAKYILHRIGDAPLT